MKSRFSFGVWIVLVHSAMQKENCDAWMTTLFPSRQLRPISSITKQLQQQQLLLTKSYYDGSVRHTSVVIVRNSASPSSSEQQQVHTAGNNDNKSNINTSSYTEQELEIISQIAARCTDAGDDLVALQKVIMESLPTMAPPMIMKLRQQDVESSTADNESVIVVFKSMQKVMQSQLDEAKEVLLQLLNAGEIRKLDNLIGKAARDGKLDVPFFNVLEANIRASMEEDQASSSNDEATTTNNPQKPTADRTSILRHIYTRCQEEVEKTIPPGTAFLNKLIRTSQQSIRVNLYKHYLLVPDDENVITTPDGKTVKLQNSGKSLIEVSDFVQAIADAVLQIRTIETSGAVDRESAAQMVEACRQIAKEARVILGERYGSDSMELTTFQERLQPVFRPASRDSPYIQGQTTATKVVTTINETANK